MFRHSKGQQGSSGWYTPLTKLSSLGLGLCFLFPFYIQGSQGSESEPQWTVRIQSRPPLVSLPPHSISTVLFQKWKAPARLAQMILKPRRYPLILPLLQRPAQPPILLFLRLWLIDGWTHRESMKRLETQTHHSQPAVADFINYYYYYFFISTVL